MRFIVLLLCCGCLAENLTVTGIHGHNVEAAYIEDVLVSELRNLPLEYKVISRDERLFKEQAMQLSGGVSQEVEIGSVIGAHKIITGTVGSSDSTVWFYGLRLMDVRTGEVLRSDYTEIHGGYSDFITGAGYALRCLFELEHSKSFRQVRVPVRSIQVHKEQRIYSNDYHVYHHSGKERPGFRPCSFCGGSGVIDGRDCPRCSRFITYSGPETGYQTMTGKWVR